MTKRMQYEEIAAGWGLGRVVSGYEVRLSDGWRGVGETLDEAVRAAEMARDTHKARVERMQSAAHARCVERDAELRERNGGKRPDAVDF